MLCAPVRRLFAALAVHHSVSVGVVVVLGMIDRAVRSLDSLAWYRFQDMAQ